MQLAGKTAIVTGSTSGIGPGLARSSAEAGKHDRRPVSDVRYRLFD